MEHARNDSAYSGASTPTSEAFTLGVLYPIVPGRLSLTVHLNQEHSREEIDRNRKLFFFSSDFQEAYVPFCLDFGPVNLGVVHEFCDFVAERWNDARLQARELVYYTEPDVDLRTNTAFLLAAFLVTRLNYSPEEAWAPFARIPPTEDGSGAFAAFRDATYSQSGYGLSIRSCLDGLAKGVSLGWYNPCTFDVDSYLYWEDPSVGDMHFICPKFCAMRGPSRTCQELAPGCFTFPPRHYAQSFKAMGITSVVRLNEPDTYDAEDFTSAGFKHHDLYFHDCTTPSLELVFQFLEIAEQEEGGVAVHCHAGLGRTGCMISCYMMKHHGFTAAECIAWLRIVRPGSVLGKQQEFLHSFEDAMRSGGWEQLKASDTQPQDMELCAGMGNEVALAQARRAQKMHPEATVPRPDEMPDLSRLLDLTGQPATDKRKVSHGSFSSLFSLPSSGAGEPPRVEPNRRGSNGVLSSIGDMLLQAMQKRYTKGGFKLPDSKMLSQARRGSQQSVEASISDRRAKEEYGRGHNVPVSVPWDIQRNDRHG